METWILLIISVLEHINRPVALLDLLNTWVQFQWVNSMLRRHLLQLLALWQPHSIWEGVYIMCARC